MKKIIFGCLFLICLTTQAQHNLPANNFVLESLKKFKSHKELVQFFGSVNVLKESGESSNGTLYYSTLYPKTNKTVDFYWDPTYKKLQYIEISTKGLWKTKEGIKVGMPINDLVKINGKHLAFNGFEIDRDVEGTITNYNKGVLSHSKMAISLGVDDPDSKYYSKFLQEHKENLTSDMPAIKPLGLKVDYIQIW